MKKIFVLLLTLSSIISANAQTDISGGLFTDTVWNSNGSPYVINGDVALFPDYSLTIEPGVTIKFNNNAKLILRGTMSCIGTAQNQITFTSNSSAPTKGDWSGIEIDNSQGGKIIGSYILGQFADNFIKILFPSSGEILNLNHSEINNCNFALYGYDGLANFTVVLDDILIDQNNYGFVYAHNVTITNSTFSNGEKGIHSWEVPSNNNIINCEFSNFTIWPENMADGIINNCRFYNNAIGVQLKPDITIINSVIELNTIGVQTDYPYQISGANFHDNKICDNIVYNFKQFYGYPINVSNNCWCSNISEDISQTILDGYDDANLGLVTFTPYNTNCSSILLSQDNKTKLKDFLIYPNPAKEVLSLNYTTTSANQIQIFTLDGKQVITEKLNPFINEKSIDVSKLANGSYLLNLSDGNKTVATKMFLIAN